MSQHLDALKICEQNNSRHLIRFYFATSTTIQKLKNSSDNETIVKSIALWLSVWKKWCSEKGIAKEIENYEPTQLNTLFERYYAEIKNKHGETAETMIPFHRKWFWRRLNNSLYCLARLWTFLRLEDVKILLCIIVLIVRGCFDRTHKVTCRLWVNYFCSWCARFASA